jgi:hypothetical protein
MAAGLAAADVTGVVSQDTGNAAVMQPELETIAGSQQLTAIYDAAFDMCLDLRSDSTTSPSKGTRGGQGNKAGDDHDPRYRRDAPARLRHLFVLGTHGGHWKITQYMYQQMPEQSGGGCSGI